MKMMIQRLLPLSAALAAAFLPGLMRADVVLDSEAGLAACMFNINASSCGLVGQQYGDPANSTGVETGVTTTGNSVVITEHPAWRQLPVVNPGDSADSSAQWIGAVDSGYGDSTFVQYNLNAPVYQITSQEFAGSALDFDVWADDSVGVYLIDLTTSNRLQIFAATNTQGSPNCSGQVVSCTPPTEGAFTGALSSGDTYELQFNVWQTGTGQDTSSNPTGLLYTGDVTGTESMLITRTETVPEPGAVTLLATMLMAVASLAAILKKKLA
jgi:hypothetical protein